MKDIKQIVKLMSLLRKQMTTEQELKLLDNLEQYLTEEWRDVKGYEGLYQVSNLGRVQSFHHGFPRILKPVLTKDNYLQVTLVKDRKSRTHRIHILVACAFIPNPMQKPEVNHIDGNRQNNRVENLEWVTSSENTQHAFRIGLMKSGAEHPNALLTEEQVKEIRRIYIFGDKNFGITPLARRFGVNPTVIYYVVHNKTYKNVK